MKMFKNTIFWLRLLKNFLYNTKSSAINLIFDQIITCNDNIWIKHSVLRSVFLIQQLYCLSASSMTIINLLTRIDIKLLICQNISLSSTKMTYIWTCHVFKQFLIDAITHLKSFTIYRSSLSFATFISNLSSILWA